MISVPIPAASVRDSVFDYLASALAFGPSRSLGETVTRGNAIGGCQGGLLTRIAAATEWEWGAGGFGPRGRAGGGSRL
jgi:hypothetical protein